MNKMDELNFRERVARLGTLDAADVDALVADPGVVGELIDLADHEAIELSLQVSALVAEVADDADDSAFDEAHFLNQEASAWVETGRLLRSLLVAPSMVAAAA